MTGIKFANLFDVSRNVLAMIAVTIASTASITHAIAETADQVALEHFGQELIQPYDGCRLAFWSGNGSTRLQDLSYYFFAPFNDGEMLPAWIKLGGRIEELERKDAVGANGLFDSYQLFQNTPGTVTLILEINDHSIEGDIETVADAKITVIKKGKVPFIASRLKGHLFCPSAYVDQVESEFDQSFEESPGDPISLYLSVDHDNFNEVPEPIINHLNSNMPDCDLSSVPEHAISHKISENMTLWKLPCALYARNTSSVFFTALDDNPNHFAPLEVAEWPLSSKGTRATLLNAKIEHESATISSVSLGPQSDCGTFEVHQLRAVEGEAIELRLVEYRSKAICDGKQTPPKAFPLIYLAE